MSENTVTPVEKNTLVTKIIKHRMSIAAFTAGVATSVLVTRYLRALNEELETPELPVS